MAQSLLITKSKWFWTINCTKNKSNKEHISNRSEKICINNKTSCSNKYKYSFNNNNNYKYNKCTRCKWLIKIIMRRNLKKIKKMKNNKFQTKTHFNLKRKNLTWNRFISKRKIILLIIKTKHNKIRTKCNIYKIYWIFRRKYRYQ